jgi:hypothetical protein
MNAVNGTPDQCGMNTLLNENHIIEAVERAFSERGYGIASKCDTKQRGIDLHVQNDSGDEWFIEAKGGTSADANSSRFGQPFNGAQVSVHVAKAIYQAMSMRSKHEKAGVAIALPDDQYHRKEIEAVGKCLERLNIVVIWVKNMGRVELPSNL